MTPTSNTPTPPASPTAPASSGSSPSTQSSAGALGSLTNEQTFLQLLVAQLENQDPTEPQDGTQFVSELAQFSSLEQEIQMRTDLDNINTILTTDRPAPPVLIDTNFSATVLGTTSHSES